MLKVVKTHTVGQQKRLAWQNSICVFFFPFAWLANPTAGKQIVWRFISLASFKQVILYPKYYKNYAFFLAHSNLQFSHEKLKKELKSRNFQYCPAGPKTTKVEDLFEFL